MATVTSKGQITLPKEVRDALGLQPGSQVEFEVVEGKAILRKRVPRRVFERWRGFLRKKGGWRTDEVMADLRDT
jgi:AbrB family looped-hinge helix DNA binding protein